MEYLKNHEHVIPTPGLNCSQYETGDIGIVEIYEKEEVFLIVQFTAGTEDYNVLAKCADKRMAGAIREISIEILEREDRAEAERERIKIIAEESW